MAEGASFSTTEITRINKILADVSEALKKMREEVEANSSVFNRVNDTSIHRAWGVNVGDSSHRQGVVAQKVLPIIGEGIDLMAAKQQEVEKSLTAYLRAQEENMEAAAKAAKAAEGEE